MPHGDLSDAAGILCIGTGISMIFAPQYYSTDTAVSLPEVGGHSLGFTMKSMFSEDLPQSAEIVSLLKLVGALLLAIGGTFLSLILSVVLFVSTSGTVFSSISCLSPPPFLSFCCFLFFLLLLFLPPAR